MTNKERARHFLFYLCGNEPDARVLEKLEAELDFSYAEGYSDGYTDKEGGV